MPRGQHREVGTVAREEGVPCFRGQLLPHVVVALCSQTF